MPAGVRVETAQENADRGSEEIRDNLGFLPTFLLVFAFVALFVGAFLIFNTFSITVAQRITEFGMLRTLGASRRQILTSVVVEALAIGLLGALLGIAGGFLIAMLLNALLRGVRHRPADHRSRDGDADHRRLPRDRHPRHAALLAGPGAALDQGAADRRPAGLRAAGRAAAAGCSARFSLLLGVAGLAMVLIGLFGSGDAGTAAGLMGGGAVVIVLAVSLFSPRLVPPLATVAGWPLERLRRLLGRLARENAQRNPSRTAVTAAALMIGLALVTFVTVFAAGLKSSVAQVVDENFDGGLVIQNSDGFSPIPAGAAAAARKVPGVELVATIRAAKAKLLGGGAGRRVSAPTPRHGRDGRRRMEGGRAGDTAPPRDGEAILSDSLRLRPRSRSGRPLPPAQPDAPPARLPRHRRVLARSSTSSAAC